jgi:hypothetical protein
MPSSRPRRAASGSLLRASLLMATLGVAALGSAACGASDPGPVRSPFDDRGMTPAAAAPSGSVPAGLPTPLATASPAATAATPPALSPGGEQEAIAGLAIEAMAEWTGQPQTAFDLESVEAERWPDACLGIARPDLACATVITPGWRVVLRDPFGEPHELRASAEGRLAWAPRETARGRVADVDAVAGRVVLETDAGRIELQRVPGTSGTLRDLSAGVEAAVGYDAAPDGSGRFVIVWVALA